MNLVVAPLVALSLITLSTISAAEEPYRMEEVYVSASRLAGGAP